MKPMAEQDSLSDALLNCAKEQSMQTGILIRTLFSKAGVEVPASDEQQKLREKVAWIATETIVAMDHKFDDDRESFGDIRNAAHLTTQLNNTEIHIGGHKLTVEDAMDTINHMLTSRGLYTKEAQEIIAGSISNLVSNVIPTMAAIESKGANASLDDAKQLREATNKGFARWEFDILYANLAVSLGSDKYNEIRGKYEAIAFATSIGDDVLDVKDDINQDRVSLLVAAVKHTSELAQLQAVVDSPGNEETLKSRNRAAIAELVCGAAPNAYSILWGYQEKELKTGNSELTKAKIGLPPLTKTS